MSISEPMGKGNWGDRLLRLLSNKRFTTNLAFALVVAAVLLGSFTYMTLTGLMPFPPAPQLTSWLLYGNLVIVLMLFALISWRLARIVMARISGAAGAKLHFRLVTMFAVVAVMPAIIVAVFATVTLHRGLDSWFGERTRAIIYSAETVAEAYMHEHQQVLRGDALAMTSDLDRASPMLKTDPDRFQQLLRAQAVWRSLPSAYVIKSDGTVLSRALANLIFSLEMPSTEAFNRANAGETALWIESEQNQMRALVKLPSQKDMYLYVARVVTPQVLDYMAQARANVAEYKSLEQGRVSVQIAFALIYVALTFILLLAAIWLGLWAANRLVTPITNLVEASERVSRGDLSARVEEGGSHDELDTLSSSFNRMTSQLESQRKDLIEANHQLDQRRQFTEAVLSGVSAGVLGIDGQGIINHANRAAQRFFRMTEANLIGRYISVVVPEFGDIVANATHHPEHLAQGQVLIRREGIERTLNVRVTGEVAEAGLGGSVITFDDITELVQAQRTSAWADIARRIAHEIKNPLTPIQLSAERLRRKYSNEISTDPDVFAQCTDTIIRQVNDIGRMVDEFSSFARMPTAVIKPIEVNEIVRQAVFLQRVANPDIVFTLEMPEQAVIVDCDARLVSQALTNILKNAVEAIRGHDGEEEAGASGASPIGQILTRLELTEKGTVISVTDSGCGLPETDRTRLTEPYMTTRTKGTGLGLAIVNKVMEDHRGRLVLEDAPVTENWESGARVSLIFPLSKDQEAKSPRADARAAEEV